MKQEEEEIELMKWEKDIECDGGVLTLWPACVVENGQAEKVHEMFKIDFGIEPVIVGCVITLPDPEHRDMEEPPTGGRCDFFFWVKPEHIGKFAIKRLMTGMKWWEDVYGNGQEDIYPQEFLDAYPPQW